MGVMRFVVSPPERNTEQVVEQAYLTGFDRIPAVVQTRAESDCLIVQRSGNESVNLHVPWDVPGHARLMLSTGSLIERPQPYALPLELARGRLVQVRNQMAEWEQAGLAIPEPLQARLGEAVRQFGQAVIDQNNREESNRLAESALRGGLDAAAMLTTAYVEQTLPLRMRFNGRLPVLLAGDLGASVPDKATAARFPETFNAASIPFCWRQIETQQGSFQWNNCDEQVAWCEAHGLPIYVGPLLELERRSLPDWVQPWGDHFEALFSFVSSYVQAVATRYRGKVAVWNCAGRVNSSDVLPLNEEQHLRLAAQVVEMIRSIDREAGVILSVNQPWGEYLIHRQREFPPWQFADVLVRAGLGLSGLMVEVNLGYFPGGTLLRDSLDWNRLLDYWAVLGLPLHISLCLPSSSKTDPLATYRVRVDESWNSRAQQEWVAKNVPFLLSKPYVAGIVWNQLRDCEPHDFPYGGVFDARRRPKPVQRALASIRQTYLR